MMVLFSFSHSTHLGDDLFHVHRDLLVNNDLDRSWHFLCYNLFHIHRGFLLHNTLHNALYFERSRHLANDNLIVRHRHLVSDDAIHKNFFDDRFFNDDVGGNLHWHRNLFSDDFLDWYLGTKEETEYATTLITPSHMKWKLSRQNIPNQLSNTST